MVVFKISFERFWRVVVTATIHVSACTYNGKDIPCLTLQKLRRDRRERGKIIEQTDTAIRVSLRERIQSLFASSE